MPVVDVIRFIWLQLYVLFLIIGWPMYMLSCIYPSNNLNKRGGLHFRGPFFYSSKKKKTLISTFGNVIQETWTLAVLSRVLVHYILSVVSFFGPGMITDFLSSLKLKFLTKRIKVFNGITIWIFSTIILWAYWLASMDFLTVQHCLLFIYN